MVNVDPKPLVDFVGYKFDLKEGKVRPTPECWQTLNAKIQKLLSKPTFLVLQLMSLTGLVTATEKQFHLGQLHMKQIQWHLKNNWRVPESVEKVIPFIRSLHSLNMVVPGRKCSSRPTITPTHLCSENLYKRIKKGWALLRGTHSKGNLVPSRKQVAP